MLDLKEKLADGLRDVMSCECRILVGSMVPWKYGECVKRLERIRRIYSVKKHAYSFSYVAGKTGKDAWNVNSNSEHIKHLWRRTLLR